MYIYIYTYILLLIPVYGVVSTLLVQGSTCGARSFDATYSPACLHVTS